MFCEAFQVNVLMKLDKIIEYQQEGLTMMRQLICARRIKACMSYYKLLLLRTFFCSTFSLHENCIQTYVGYYWTINISFIHNTVMIEH